MSSLDLAILLPVMPLAPIAITWWLPWDHWIPWGKLPKRYLGPYLLYVAFAAWHFKFDWKAVLIVAMAGTFFLVGVVWELTDKRKKNDP
jgi:hypothetical protein